MARQASPLVESYDFEPGEFDGEASVATPENRKDPRSKLMKAKGKALQGEKVNACPYGCELRQLDDNGYCRHLIGFTNDQKSYEPMVKRRGRRVVWVDLRCPECGFKCTREQAVKQTKRQAVEGGEYEREQDVFEEALTCPTCGPEFPLEPDLLPIRKGDKMVRITTSYRVYRGEGKAAEPETPAQTETIADLKERLKALEELVTKPEAKPEPEQVVEK